MALVAALPFAVQGQQKRTTQQKAVAAAKAPAKRVSSSKGSSSKGRSSSSKGKSSKNASAKQKEKYTNSSIRGLQNQRSQVQKKIRQQEQALRANQADVKKRLRTSWSSTRR